MECIDHVVSEGFPLQMPKSVRTNHTLKRAMTSPRAFASNKYDYDDAQLQVLCMASTKEHNLDRAQLALLLQLWDEIMTDYATRQLTRWSDRLVAFDAILSSLTMCEFLGSERFGHWERLLPWDLLWSCPASQTPQRRFA